MISQALNAIFEEIKTYLISIDNFDHNLKISLPSENRNLSAHAESICLSIINVQEEKVLRSQNNYEFRSNDRISHRNPDLRLTLFILVAADFSDHERALANLSDIISFFQSKHVFTGENTPSLDSSIEKMIVDLYSMNFETQNHLWGVLGATYKPSVLYRIQTLIIQENLRKDDQKPILTVHFSNNQT
jgi:hypothetical protein